MIFKKIQYNRVVQSVAMSKGPKQSGLFLSHDKTDNTIKIQAINPKLNDITSYLSMEVPVEELDSLICSLTELKKDLENNVIE